MKTAWRLRLAWSGALLLALAAVWWRAVPLADASARLEVVAAGRGQRLEPLQLAEWEADYFGKARARRWVAIGRGAPMVFTVVDGSGNRRAVHDPAYCFRGAGWTVEETDSLALPHGEAARVRLRRGAEALEVAYWFSDGRRAYSSPTRYWKATTLRRLTRGRSGPEPVLVILVPAQAGAVSWAEWIEQWPQAMRL